MSTTEDTKNHPLNPYIPPLVNYRTVSADSPAHTGDLQYAEDYDCPEGTEIHAALAGTVVYMKDDSKEGGQLDEKYWNSGNRIVLAHDHGEYTAYEHLRYKGVTVKIGQEVKQGQIIGYTGNTGYSSVPHLHFEVFIHPKNDKSEGVTIPIRFAS